MKKTKTISPTMKLLKENGLIRVTFERYFDGRSDKFMYQEANKGHFTVSTGRGMKYFTLEVRYKENFEKIQEVLTKNGVEFTANYGSLIDIKY
jgi:hypothetical protein